MGCDIHFYVEVFKEDRWELAPGQLMDCENCMGTKLDPERKHCATCGKQEHEHEEGTGKCWFEAGSLRLVPSPCRWGCLDGQDLDARFYRGRDYDLFGILSDVRGAADSEFTKACLLPSDLSPEIAHAAKGPDWHSHSSYTLAELQEFPWREKDFTSFAETLLKMQELDPNSDNVRAVFWYDN